MIDSPRHFCCPWIFLFYFFFLKKKGFSVVLCLQMIIHKMKMKEALQCDSAWKSSRLLLTKKISCNFLFEKINCIKVSKPSPFSTPRSPTFAVLESASLCMCSISICDLLLKRVTAEHPRTHHLRDELVCCILAIFVLIVLSVKALSYSQPTTLYSTHFTFQGAQSSPHWRKSRVIISPKVVLRHLAIPQIIQALWSTTSGRAFSQQATLHCERQTRSLRPQARHACADVRLCKDHHRFAIDIDMLF